MTVTWRGFKFDPSTVSKLELAEAWIRHDRPELPALSFYQGSYSTGVAASANTHGGGGAVDVKVTGDTSLEKVSKVHYLRAVGFAAWHRPYNWDGARGVEHIHAIELSNTNVSSAAAQQKTQYREGLNGLANQARDGDAIDVSAGRPSGLTTPPAAPVTFPAANPAKQIGTDMLIVTYPKTTKGKTYTWHGDFLLSGGTLFHIVTEADKAAFAKAGVKTSPVSYAQWLALGGKA